MFKMGFLCCTLLQGGRKKKQQRWKKTGRTSVSGYSGMNTFVKTVSFALSRRSFTTWSHRLATACVMWFHGLRSLYLQLWLSGLSFMSCKFRKCRFKQKKKKTMTQPPPSKTRHLVVVSVGGCEVCRFLEFHSCIFPSPKIVSPFCFSFKCLRVKSTLLNGR